ncbi:MAG TPA: hypothetical protein VI796_05150 [Candidatus Thermoplasmatota archaeon]|nr:hypothetical protein [Candidatus Thermoplasmatota archaeon]
MAGGTLNSILTHHRRNDALVDLWSVGHLILGVVFGWVMPGFLALALLVLWEPFEIFVLHPLILRLTGKVFGFESLRNSLSDIVFDTAGVALGVYGLRAWLDAPFFLG